ncbi:MAG: hypothetical protein WKF81_07915 [Thermomicrobiales bacterium]
MVAGVALQLAIRYSASVGWQIVNSVAMRRDGNYPEILTFFEHMADMAPTFAE